MGFNKRFVTTESLKVAFENKEPLSRLFKADALIFMDKVASDAFTLFQEGKSDEYIKEIVYGREL